MSSFTDITMPTLLVTTGKQPTEKSTFQEIAVPKKASKQIIIFSLLGRRENLPGQARKQKKNKTISSGGE